MVAVVTRRSPWCRRLHVSAFGRSPPSRARCTCPLAIVSLVASCCFPLSMMGWIWLSCLTRASLCSSLARHQKCSSVALAWAARSRLLLLYAPFFVGGSRLARPPSLSSCVMSFRRPLVDRRRRLLPAVRHHHNLLPTDTHRVVARTGLSVFHHVGVAVGLHWLVSGLG